ncbi:TetR/AcrR family transcriptional regulator [Pontibacter sp. G13]|uniref:TetR/AcrR family transcriptional regulator n=1 Tax=Pontibacter sp. G13 TaxID=3074898 RepID=UPI00288B6C0B|nr:TetR/AcrR family transcriptional regulator [Pontibacter sp. G13]WNJ18355.1 TetR/AcrR family transcriptional regulator [Pontibacter sp. G13]
MSKKRQLILDTARTLFNQQGFAQVTIRMIAQELGMSSGNLNYHFKKRSDIFEALYFEMVGIFDRRVDELPNHTFTFEAIQSDIRTSMEVMVQYRFFWTDMHFLLKDHPNVRAHFEGAYQKRKAGYTYLFGQLRQLGLMLEPEFSRQFHDLGERMIAYSNTWIYASKLYLSSNISPEDIGYQSNQLLSMMYPYLSSQGKQLLKPLLEDSVPTES